ncbi:MAG: hypothetical protein JNM07_13530 [Phycisphaerae bacterium]|nr:hypothetical protein [Phycisphaerae bacterium]
MSPVRLLISVLLILVQGMNLLGPRAICRDPDGSVCYDSPLSPCCCKAHCGPACCDDGCDEDKADPHHQSTVSAAGCGCVCTPVAADAQISAPTREKAAADVKAFDLGVQPFALLASHWVPPARIWCGTLAAGPPGGGRFALTHLDTVILRL